MEKTKKRNIFFIQFIRKFFIKKINELVKNGIKLKIIGDKKVFSTNLKKILKESEKKTSKNKKLQINLALNYGSKDEILQAVKIIKKDKAKFTEKNIEKNLYTQNIPNPDLLIRTGNTNRLSNFCTMAISVYRNFF